MSALDDGRGNRDPREYHDLLIRLDREYRTHPSSPLHHNNRACKWCADAIDGLVGGS